ncbi:hypothetical protein ACEQ8H_006555 [Pleosporales sp. CAS-2024a]
MDANTQEALQKPNIRYHTNKTITAGMSPFAGGPSEKVDGAWRDLMSSISVRVSPEELSKNGNHNESVSLPAGGGNLVWLNVFHQLHCLLRQAVMCSPDTSFTTFVWTHSDPKPVLDFSLKYQRLNTLMFPSVTKARDTTQLSIDRFKMQIRVAHEHLAQKVYTVPSMPICAVVFELRHVNAVASFYCVENNVVGVSDSVLQDRVLVKELDIEL